MNFGFAPGIGWAEVGHLLLPAIARGGEYSAEEVRAAIADGTAQLWVGRDERIRVAVVTRLHSFARGLVCEIWLLGGVGWADWIGFIDRIEAAARERGCVAIEFTGRAGWARLLPDYRRTAVVLTKPLLAQDMRSSKDGQK